MSSNEYCKDCINFRGYSNTGYYCDIDKAEIEKYESCKAFKSEDDN